MPGSFNGDLVVTGDQQDNELYVFQIDSDSFALFGENGTKINGLSGHPFHGVTDDLRINLRNGDNKIALQGVDLADDLRIRSGNGEDTIIVQEATVRSDVNIRTGGGADTVMVQDTTIGGLHRVMTAAGNDELLVSTSTMVRAVVQTGSGNDEAFLRNLEFHQPSRVRLGGGEDLAWLGSGHEYDSDQ